MLFILFQIGEDSFALDAQQIEEVLPLLELTHIPAAEAGIAGVFSYRGAPVPVIDLSALMLGRPSLGRLSTRLIVMNFQGQDDSVHWLGLIAEKATETLRCDPSDFTPSGVSSEGAPFLGPVVHHAGRLVQWVEIDKLLSPAVAASLFKSLQDCA